MSRRTVAIRAAAILVAVTGLAFGLALMVGRPFENVVVSGVLYSFAAIGSGLVLIAAAHVAHEGSRFAWTMIGAGIVSWGIGEVVWTVQSEVGEIPYPGVADFFYVVGYPLILAGVVALPYLRPGRFERLRLAIDAAAGAVSLAVVMWVIYLHQVVGPGVEPVESFLNVAYPFGDVLLITALMVMAMRRSEHRLDLRVILLAGAIALTAAADVAFSLLSAADEYVEWGRLDGVWLVGYALFALAAWGVTRPPASHETTYRSMTTWQMVAPYGAVATLFLLRLITSSGNDLLLNFATTTVAVLIVVRLNLSVREKGELLAQQRDDLVASVSHELRTPLTGIQGYSDILSESWETLSDDDRNEMLSTIGVQANQLGRIVSDLIDVSRDRLHNLHLIRVDCSAAGIVDEAVAALGGKSEIRVETETDARVWAEPDRIRQVLSNLITNAVRYGGDEILVTAGRTGQVVEFAVHDNGEGVPLKYQSKMWERFERGFHTHNTGMQGSGIGLSVARDLVTAHGGTIQYRTSELLGGACFEFTIPTPPTARSTSDADELAPVTSGASNAPRAHGD